MRCRLILLISEHPIQQGIRKGGGPLFGYGRGRGFIRFVGIICQKRGVLYKKKLVVFLPFFAEKGGGSS